MHPAIELAVAATVASAVLGLLLVLNAIRHHLKRLADIEAWRGHNGRR